MMVQFLSVSPDMAANEVFHNLELALENARTVDEVSYWQGRIEKLEDMLAEV